jgi:hypothetical protein
MECEIVDLCLGLKKRYRQRHDARISGVVKVFNSQHRTNKTQIIVS